MILDVIPVRYGVFRSYSTKTVILDVIPQKYSDFRRYSQKSVFWRYSSKIVNLDVFSRRFSREKCPTLTVASFFPFFVRLKSHSDWATFLTIETTKTTTIRPNPVSGN